MSNNILKCVFSIKSNLDLSLILIFINKKYFFSKVPVDDGSMEEMLTPRELIANFWNQSGPKVGIDDMEVLNPHCNPF